MSILHSIVLGILQGIAEFFPISSSAHLILFPWLAGWDDFGDDESLKRAFDVALHLGTLLALLYHFRLEIYQVLKSKDYEFVGKIALASIPAALIGVLLFNEDSVEKIWLVSTLLIVFGVLLFLVDLFCSTDKTLKDFNFQEAAYFGLAQAAALWPGVSRSGIIITAARARGFGRIAAVNISFWMAIPILLGAGVYKFIDIGGVEGIPSDMRPAFLVGTVVSAVVGLITLKVLIKLVERITFAPLVAERVVVGAGALIVLATTSL